ncbi:MAG: hypothetical protein IJ336_08330 [Lachnospiraceae bacterium]|nr:hypothetical protein [Lachnospiraceae bacterium]
MKKIKYFVLICLMASFLAGCLSPATNDANGAVGGNEVVDEDNSDEFSEEIESEDEEEFIEDEEEEVEVDYTEEAEDILSQVESFFDALSTGDIDTLVSMCDEDQEYYEYLTAMSEYDFTPEFLQILYGDTRYYIEEDALDDLISDLESFHEDGDDDYISIDVVYSYRYMFLMGEVYPLAFEEGTLIEERIKYNNNDEAMVEIAKAVSHIPCVSHSAFDIKIKEDGKIVIALDEVIGNMEIEEIGDINEKYPMHYAEEFLEVSTMDVTVGGVGNGFKENNDIFVEIDRLLAANDYAGLTEYLGSVTGEDYKTEYSEEYGSYEELTDEQKAFVDEYVNDGFKYQFIVYVVADEDSPMYNYRNGTFFLTSPELDITDPVLTQWYRENDINDVTISYSSSTKLPLFDEFIYRYYYAIQYAKEYV